MVLYVMRQDAHKVILIQLQKDHITPKIVGGVDSQINVKVKIGNILSFVLFHVPGRTFHNGRKI